MRGILLRHFILAEKEPHGPGGAAMTFDWATGGVAWKMNAARRQPGIEYSDSDAT